MLTGGLGDVNEESQPESENEWRRRAIPSIRYGEGLLLPYLKSLVHVVTAAWHRSGSFPAGNLGDQGLCCKHQRRDRGGVLEC